MRLHMIQLHPFLIQEPFQGANLVDGHGGQFLGTQLHLAAAETLEVGQAGVCADEDGVRDAGADGGGHDEGVAGVEAAGDVGDVDQGEEFFVRTLWQGTSVIYRCRVGGEWGDGGRRTHFRFP